MATTIPQNLDILGWAIQSAKGSAASASANRVWLAGGDLPHSAPVRAPFKESHGFQIDQDAYMSSIQGMGSPQHNVMPLMIGSLAKCILGRDTKTGGSDPYSHTADWGAANAPVPLPYVTAWANTGGSLFEKLVDLRCTHVKIHGEAGRPLVVTVTWLGGVPSFLSAEETTATLEKSSRFLYYDGKAALKFEGAALPLARSFDLDIDRGVSLVPGDSYTPNDTVEGPLTVTLALTYLPAEFQLFNRVVYGTASPSNNAVPTTSPLELAGSPAGIDFKFIRSTGPERSVEFLVPRVQVVPFVDPINPGTPGPIVRTVTLEAVGPSDGSSPISIVTLNSLSTAY